MKKALNLYLCNYSQLQTNHHIATRKKYDMDEPKIPFVDPYVAKRMKKLLQEEQSLLEEEMKTNIRNKKEALKYFEAEKEQESKQNNEGVDSKSKDPEPSPSMVG